MGSVQLMALLSFIIVAAILETLVQCLIDESLLDVMQLQQQ